MQLLARLNRPRSIAGTAGVDVTTQALLAEVVDVLYDRVRGPGQASTPSSSDTWMISEMIRTVFAKRFALIRLYLRTRSKKAAGKNIRSLKSDDVVFDTVIVNEAARADPLDLLIPMTRTARRIVLVGDHRQLPHLLEPDVERELERSVLDEARENLRKSLFLRLFTLLEAREAEDGVRRVVTSNTQYPWIRRRSSMSMSNAWASSSSSCSHISLDSALPPMGTVRKRREFCPRPITSSDPQAGQQYDSRGCSIVKITSPPTYSVFTYL